MGPAFLFPKFVKSNERPAHASDHRTGGDGRGAGVS
jgi:hypothetical protein